MCLARTYLAAALRNMDLSRHPQIFSEVLLDPTGNAVNSSMGRVGGDEFRVSQRGERGSNLSESRKEAREKERLGGCGKKLGPTWHLMTWRMMRWHLDLTWH